MIKKLLFLCVLFTSMVYAQIPTNGIIGNYEFSNGSLSNSISGPGFSQSGTNMTIKNDRLGNALNAISLNGDRLVRSDISYSGNQSTISFWIKTTENSSVVKTIFDDANGRNSVADNHNWSGHYILLQNGKVGYVVSQLYQSSFVGNGGRVGVKKVSTKFIADGNWHHVALSFRHTNTGTGQYRNGREIRSYKTYGKLYVDGVLSITSYDARGSEYGFKANGNWQTNGNVTVASNRSNNLPSANRYRDSFDDLLFYNRELSATEVQNIAAFNSNCFVLPTNTISFTNLGTTNANVQINKTGIFDVAYHKTSEPFSNATITSAIDNSSGTNNVVNLTNLDPFTEYSVYIKTNSTCQNWSDEKKFNSLRPNVPYYVNVNATGDESGTSWANAYKSVQEALAAITATGKEIWIAKGIYTPHTSDRSVSFETPFGVKIYGGFIGTETNLSQRDFNANPTILSGDIQNDDNTTIAYNNSTKSDNSLHVLKITSNDVLIDGVTIQNGNANGSSNDERGSGIFVNPTITNLFIKNSKIKNNVSRRAGVVSAYFTVNSSVTIENCMFDNNLSSWGTALYFLANGNGNTANFKVYNSLFINNKTQNETSSLRAYTGSSIWFRASGVNTNVTTTIVNNTFANNIDIGTQAGSERGTLALSRRTDGNSTHNATIANSIIFGNTRAGGITTLDVNKGHVTLPNQVLVYNSIGEEGFTNIVSSNLVNSSSSNPGFINPSNNDFTLQDCSKAVNGGDNSKVPSGLVKDLLGNQRITNTTIDMGAYEKSTTSVCRTLTLNIVGNGVVKNNGNIVSSGDTFSETTVLSLIPEANSGFAFEKWTGAAVGNSNPLSLLIDVDKTITVTFKASPTPIYVDINATGSNNGSSWANAYNSLVTALASATAQSNIIWIADGTYRRGGGTNNFFNVDKENLKIYGGFSGTETKINQRNFYTNKTILSGDIFGNDSGSLTFNNSTRSDNNRTVMRVSKNNVIIDGITIKGGHAFAANLTGSTGAPGILITSTVNNFTLKNSTITDNLSDKTGPIVGAFTVDTTVNIENCLFYNNISGYGTLYLLGNGANKTATFNVINTSFYKNKTMNIHHQKGYTGSSLWLRASATGSNVTSNIINCTFANNTDVGTQTGSERGTLALSRRSDATSNHNVNISNSIVYGNVGAGNTTTSDINKGHVGIADQILINNSIGENNFSNITASNLTSTNNSNPLFVDTVNNDFTLQSSSPAKDTGDNTKIPTGIVVDLLGKIRIHNTTVDMGAYEYGASTYIPRKLIINAVGGTVATNPNPTNGTYNDGDSVVLTATPNAGYQFDGWSGDASGTTNPVTVVMNADKTVTATFSKIQRTLTINATNGTVTTNPNPISGTYNEGTSVVLTATPNTGYQFDGWSGDASGTTNPVTVVMNADKTVTATFSKIQRTLTINATNGAVSTNPNPTSGMYDDGTSVMLTATPNTGYQFDGWSGDASGTTNPLTVVMSANKTVTATFSKIQRTLTINASNGTVTTNPNPTSGTYDDGTSVMLTATPNTGYQFDGWSGDVSGTTNPVTVVMNADKTVTATFSKIQRILTINATNGAVSTNPNPTNGKYDDGTSVVLTVIPNAGYQFDGWSGDASGTTNPVTVVMNANKTVTATFSKIQRTLTINATNGTVSTNPNPTNGTYDDGASVVLTATPNAGYQFDGWSGDASGTTNPVTVVMNANKTVTATFSKIQRTLTINATNGTVSTNPNPTNGTYDDGASVVLTATPNAGYQFDGWSGDASGTTNPVTVVMNADKTVTATFSKIQRILTINATNGVVTTNPNPTNGKYDDGTSVVLTAMPNAGYQFDGWSGDASGTTNPLTVVMNANKTVTATFSKIQRTLTINASNGTVTTNPNPTSGTYDDGTSVVLTAMPNAGYQFDGWSGDASGTSNPLTVVMSGDKTVTAMFSRIMRTLTVTKAGNGTVTTNPNVTGGYVDGTNVTLTATPDSGWKFDGWSGDASGTTNQTTVTMNANKSITATFSQVTAGIEDEKKLKDFAVYPNPVETILRLQLNEQVKEITIYSIQGREVKTSKEREVNISDLSSGIYLIKVQTDNDKIGIKKFVKK
ncbi:InlB B-repeat-containing protein [uncultured Tenacibaculum sp.]|uniref:InlB B-repeat-containing protein n=1 Tax=uncultured Tenacibaculum sp. TaxID=174713 RepID=UPI0026197AB2|nr:InlB B-repeat-containing protein [uncultured Tenacibaculum sp.]